VLPAHAIGAFVGRPHRLGRSPGWPPQSAKEADTVAGGVAIYVSTVIVLALGLWLAPDWRVIFTGQWQSFAALLAASFVLVVVGVIDDKRGMRGRYKVLGQIVAASIVIAVASWLAP